MSLYEAMKRLKFDKRVTGWNLKHGHLSQDEFNGHLAQLEDSSGNVLETSHSESRTENAVEASGPSPSGDGGDPYSFNS